MKDDKMPQNDENTQEENNLKYSGKTYFYIGVGACVAGAVAFALAFTVLGIYSLIASILLELAALSFITTQQKKNNFRAVYYAKIATYALLIAFSFFFVGGLIYSAIQ